MRGCIRRPNLQTTLSLAPEPRSGRRANWRRAWLSAMGRSSPRTCSGGGLTDRSAVAAGRFGNAQGGSRGRPDVVVGTWCELESGVVLGRVEPGRGAVPPLRRGAGWRGRDASRGDEGSTRTRGSGAARVLWGVGEAGRVRGGRKSRDWSRRRRALIRMSSTRPRSVMARSRLTVGCARRGRG